MTEINFKELWQGQQSDSPSPSQIIEKARQLQKNTRRKMILANLTLLATAVYIIGVVVYYKPEMITTKIGALLIFAALVMQVLASGKLISLLGKSDTQITNAEYLQRLLEVKKKQAYLQSTIMSIYFLLLSLGIGLYFIEYALRMNIVGASLTYGLTGLWIAFGWFYLRKRTIRKQQQKLNDAIAGLEKIESQFEEREL